MLKCMYKSLNDDLKVTCGKCWRGDIHVTGTHDRLGESFETCMLHFSLHLRRRKEFDFKDSFSQAKQQACPKVY